MKKIVGIDIGGSSVKLAYFAGSTLKKAAMAPLPDNMVADGRILSMDAMADFLRQAARDNGIPLTNAAVVLPSTEVFTRELTMPAMTEQQLRYNLPYEFRDFLTDEKSKYFLRSHDRNHCICKGFGDYKGKIVPSIVPSFRNRLFLYYRLGMLNA